MSNGLNQQTSIGGSAATWDSKGNLTADPTSSKSYTYYPSDDALWTASSPFAAMSYDPLGRLAIIDSGTDTKFAYDGLDAIAEYDGGNALQRRYVFGPGMDEPLVQYEGSGTTDRRFMGSDERGSIVSLTDSAGTLIAINRYDEYGKPQSTNSGRFQYTGQKWIGEAGLYDYKARAYLPHLGIFAQTDPIGDAGSPNLYAYVLNDPVNLVDPFGLECLPGLVQVGGGVWFDKNDPNGPVIINGGKCVRLLDPASPGGESGIGGTGGNAGPQNGTPHKFTIRRKSNCPANDVFNDFKRPNQSAPGAPAAREGFTPRISLVGGNPISQTVNSASRTIVNTTLEGHIFYPGDVTIHVEATRGGGSEITITGTGTGSFATFNDIVGYIWFGTAANQSAFVCHRLF